MNNYTGNYINIITEMSLLASSTANPNNTKFLQKMQRHYHKRGSSQYINRQKPTQLVSHLPKHNNQFTTKLPQSVIDKFKTLMSQFMDKVNDIIREFKIIDHYGVLEILRKHQFFSDVAVLINGDLYANIQMLQKELLAKDEKIVRLKREAKNDTINDSDKLDKIDNFSNKNMVKFNPSKSVAANIFYHARALEEEDFINYYNKTSLSNPITLKKVQSNPHKDSQNLAQKISELAQVAKTHQSEPELNELIRSIKISISSQKCRNPCCLQKPDSPDTRLNKAKTLINSNSYKPSNNVYKSDKSEQYFKRYYKGNNFNLHDVTSVSRTKMEEMEKIQTLYNKNLKARKKYEVHQHRYSCSFSGH